LNNGRAANIQGVEVVTLACCSGDSELHREVALTQILDHHADDPAGRQRFLLEAEVTGGLEHPGIVSVYGDDAEAGRDDTRPRRLTGLGGRAERSFGEFSHRTDRPDTPASLRGRAASDPARRWPRSIWAFSPPRLILLANSSGPKGWRD
jgi:hypothetical protein